MYCLTRYQYPQSAQSFDRQIDRLFANALSGYAPGAYVARFPVEFDEDKDNLYLRAELPGVARDAVALEITDGVLSIKATRKRGEETLEMARGIALPALVQADKAAATLADGILTVTLPKSEAAKPQKISLN
jgi:HSP20 family protein